MTDPNEDILGFAWTCEDGSTATVTRTCAWGAMYVTCDIYYPDKDWTMRDVVKPAAVVRRHKQIVG